MEVDQEDYDSFCESMEEDAYHDCLYDIANDEEEAWKFLRNWVCQEDATPMDEFDVCENMIPDAMAWAAGMENGQKNSLYHELYLTSLEKLVKFTTETRLSYR